MNEHEKPQIDFMHKLARQIVERRNLVFLFVILAAIFTVFSVRWVKVETDMTTYLPKTSETRMGLDIMDEQFTTYGSADVMVANITPTEADELSDRLTELKGVQMLDYDDTTDHYNKDSVSALYSITFDYPEDDDQCLEALDRVKEYLADYDIYVSTSLGNTQQETIDAEVRVIMVYVAVIIVIVLIIISIWIILRNRILGRGLYCCRAGTSARTIRTGCSRLSCDWSFIVGWIGSSSR